MIVNRRRRREHGPYSSSTEGNHWFGSFPFPVLVFDEHGFNPLGNGVWSLEEMSDDGGNTVMPIRRFAVG